MENKCHSGLDPESIKINSKNNILIICGPTASGKTSLALQLAKELPKANILSVDSRQAYSDLDIITGKDIPEDLPSTIKIFGHNLFKPNETANLADFIRYSQKVIRNSQDTNTPLIIVGGTGLYLKALTQKLSSVLVPPNPILREKLEKLSLAELQSLLEKENPQKLASLNHSDFMNPRRLIRYLELSSHHSACHSGLDPESMKISPLSGSNIHWVGLSPDKEKLKDLIRARVVERINNGAIEEVKTLLKQFPEKKLTIYSSLGVSQIIDYLENKITQEELVDIWSRAEIDYARRQIVWFKKQAGIVWYDKSINQVSLVSELKKIYQ